MKLLISIYQLRVKSCRGGGGILPPPLNIIVLDNILPPNLVYMGSLIFRNHSMIQFTKSPISLPTTQMTPADLHSAAKRHPKAQNPLSPYRPPKLPQPGRGGKRWRQVRAFSHVFVYLVIVQLVGCRHCCATIVVHAQPSK